MRRAHSAKFNLSFSANINNNRKDKQNKHAVNSFPTANKLISDQIFTVKSLALWCHWNGLPCDMGRMHSATRIRNWAEYEEKSLKCLKLDLLMNFIICWMYQTSNYRVRRINYFNSMQVGSVWYRLFSSAKYIQLITTSLQLKFGDYRKQVFFCWKSRKLRVTFWLIWRGWGLSC